ncbi:MAG: methyltransferase domain-containing protein [Mariniblastus sp.]|nr:methyltransferase domain-containing protein [Mariniblastus sp.]
MINPKPNAPLDRDEVNQMITRRLHGSRPVAWEEDISRNTLDTEPFHNLPSPSQLDPQEFSNPIRIAALEPYMAKEKLPEAIAADTYPIPSPDDREGYAPGFDGTYWMSGLEDHLKVMDAAKRYGVEPKSVFDFGCASGRVLRHFAAQTEIPEIWGSDINGRHVRWLYENMPHTVKPIFNHCIPSLPIRDNSVDVISAFSVFTHIDTFETCWLAELRRIMSDSGIAYLTVHNEDTWAAIREKIDDPKNRLIQSLIKIDPDFRENLAKQMPDTKTVYRFEQSGPYRAQVFHSNNYLQQVWGRFFTIEEILPLHHVRQTVLVLRKK